MTNKDTTPTSGAAIQRYKIGYPAEEWSQRSRTPSGIPDASGSWVRYADHVTALAAGQATAAQAGEHPALVCDYCGALTPDPWHSSGMLHGKMSKHIHSCDACAARGQAPASVLHLVHSAFAEIAMAFPKAFALHKVDIADTAVLKALAAPAPPPECETEAEKRAFAFGWFKALESERMKADNKKKDPL